MSEITARRHECRRGTPGACATFHRHRFELTRVVEVPLFHCHQQMHMDYGRRRGTPGGVRHILGFREFHPKGQ
jgi:hypothetical protein